LSDDRRRLSGRARKAVRISGGAPAQLIRRAGDAEQIVVDGAWRSERWMNEVVVSKAFVFALLILTAPSAYAEQKFQKLSGVQIRAKFSGMELTDEVHWYDLYERNGTVVSSSMGRKRQGKWWVQKDQLCTDIEKESSVRCYDVLLSGNNVQLRGEGVLPLDAVLRAPTDRR
jgi:hypothetical protein